MEKSQKQQAKHFSNNEQTSMNSDEQQCSNDFPEHKEMTAGSGTDSEENYKNDEVQRELSIIKKALAEFIIDDSIFVMHKEQKSGRIVLTEPQFNLVKKVYTGCFNKDRFSLSDNKLVL